MENSELVIVDGQAPKVFKALASPTRWKILKLLSNGTEYSVSRIAIELEQTEANISAQIKKLEKAHLVVSHYEQGVHGVKKVPELACEKIIVKLSE